MTQILYHKQTDNSWKHGIRAEVVFGNFEFPDFCCLEDNYETFVIII